VEVNRPFVRHSAPVAQPSRSSAPVPRPRERRRGWRSRLRRSLRTGDFWLLLLFAVLLLGGLAVVLRALSDLDGDRTLLPGRGPKPIRAPGISGSLAPVTPDYSALKYFASGWWKTSADTEASGSIMKPSVRWIPICSGWSSRHSVAWSARSGQAG